MKPGFQVGNPGQTQVNRSRRIGSRKIFTKAQQTFGKDEVFVKVALGGKIQHGEKLVLLERSILTKALLKANSMRNKWLFVWDEKRFSDFNLHLL